MARVEGLKGHFVSQVACGDSHTVILTSDGFVWTSGSNEDGQTGHGISRGMQSTPKRVQGGFNDTQKIVLIAANHIHTICVNEDGSTYTWGAGLYGRLGHGDETSQSSPKLVNGLIGKEVQYAVGGGSHTLIRTEDGRVYSFGYGRHGQLGHGNTKGLLTPTLIETPLEGEFVVQVACGSYHSMALARSGRLYTWGHGRHGRLGHESDKDQTIPCIVQGLDGKTVVQISSNYVHSVALVDCKRQESYAKKMKAMVNNKSCSDVVFSLKNGDRVHGIKGLLIGQSEYFRAMFRSNIRESREKKKIFLLFLEFLYTGGLNVEFDEALELYVLADRYEENGLSRQCRKVIERGRTNENAVSVLVKVDELCLDALKDSCISYILSNHSKVMKKEAIDSLSHVLIGELLLMLSLKYQ